MPQILCSPLEGETFLSLLPGHTHTYTRAFVPPVESGRARNTVSLPKSLTLLPRGWPPGQWAWDFCSGALCPFHGRVSWRLKTCLQTAAQGLLCNSWDAHVPGLNNPSLLFHLVINIIVNITINSTQHVLSAYSMPGIVQSAFTHINSILTATL